MNIIIGGRQAIDGDTAQVGPQVAEKLGLTQITYAEEILEVGDGKIKVKRHIDGGVETVEGPLPIVITVNGSAAPCRPRNAKLVPYCHAMGILITANHIEMVLVNLGDEIIKKDRIRLKFTAELSYCTEVAQKVKTFS